MYRVQRGPEKLFFLGQPKAEKYCTSCK